MSNASTLLARVKELLAELNYSSLFIVQRHPGFAFLHKVYTRWNLNTMCIPKVVFTVLVPVQKLSVTYWIYCSQTYRNSTGAQSIIKTEVCCGHRQLGDSQWSIATNPLTTKVGRHWSTVIPFGQQANSYTVMLLNIKPNLGPSTPTTLRMN